MEILKNSGYKSYLFIFRARKHYKTKSKGNVSFQVNLIVFIASYIRAFEDNGHIEQF